MVEPHYVMHGADPVPESSSARSRAGGRAATELTRPTAPPPPPTKERGGDGLLPQQRARERASSATCPLRTPMAAVTNLHKLT